MATIFYTEDGARPAKLLVRAGKGIIAPTRILAKLRQLAGDTVRASWLLKTKHIFDTRYSPLSISKLQRYGEPHCILNWWLFGVGSKMLGPLIASLHSNDCSGVQAHTAHLYQTKNGHHIYSISLRSATGGDEDVWRRRTQFGLSP